jgi:hypothetical protein
VVLPILLSTNALLNKVHGSNRLNVVLQQHLIR